jgi:hypothetical protein
MAKKTLVRMRPVPRPPFSGTSSLGPCGFVQVPLHGAYPPFCVDCGGDDPRALRVFVAGQNGFHEKILHPSLPTNLK